MLDVEGAKALFLCNGKRCCGDCTEECKHTPVEEYAKNKDSVELFKKFTESFSFVIDDDGKLLCWEKDNKED